MALYIVIAHNEEGKPYADSTVYDNHFDASISAIECDGVVRIVEVDPQ